MIVSSACEDSDVDVVVCIDDDILCVVDDGQKASAAV